MSEIVEQDRQQAVQTTRQWSENVPDPQDIEENPEVAIDPLIMKLREAFGSGKNANHLLKGRGY